MEPRISDGSTIVVHPIKHCGFPEKGTIVLSATVAVNGLCAYLCIPRLASIRTVFAICRL